MAALALGERLLSGTGRICRGVANVYLFVDVHPRGVIWTVVYRKALALDLCFSQSTSSLLNIVQDLLPTANCHADDNQLYVSFDPADENGQSDAIAAMESCVRVIRNWMHENRLLMNETKTFVDWNEAAAR